MSVTSLVYPSSSLELVVCCSRGRSRVPIECVSISSNQSSPCDFPTRGGLEYEFCSFRCPYPVEDLYMKQFWSVFADGFLENFTEVRSMFETFLGQRICSYVGELESLGQG